MAGTMGKRFRTKDGLTVVLVSAVQKKQTRAWAPLTCSDQDIEDVCRANRWADMTWELPVHPSTVNSRYLKDHLLVCLESELDEVVNEFGPVSP